MSVHPIRPGIQPPTSPIEQAQARVIERQALVLRGMADVIAHYISVNDQMTEKLRRAERQCRIAAGEKLGD